MANEQNLRPSEYKLSQEQAKKGGINSGESRRRKKDLRLALEMLLEKEYAQKDKNGNITGVVTGTEAITVKLFEQAMKGNIKAFETVRDTVGQKPVEKVMIAEVDQDVINEVENMVLSYDEETGD